MDGLLNIYKPSGPTSHDVVAAVRRIVGQKRVGHTGTLDPIAEGVMVICLGRATRLSQYIAGAEKEYRCRAVLGVATDTQDCTGRVVEQHSASAVTLERFLEVSGSFVGEIEQIPPMISALKHKGERLYDIARRGESVERKARRITIHSLEVLSFEPGERATAEMAVRCSSGTYIRTLCADIGAALGCGAHMEFLCRDRVGRFDIGESVSCERLAHLVSQGRLNECVVGMDAAVEGLPRAVVSREDARAAACGMEVACRTDAAHGCQARILDVDEVLLGIGQVIDRGGAKAVKPKTVLVEADS